MGEPWGLGAARFIISIMVHAELSMRACAEEAELHEAGVFLDCTPNFLSLKAAHPLTAFHTGLECGCMQCVNYHTAIVVKSG